MERLAGERGRLAGEVILYRLDDGRFRVYRDIPGSGSQHEVGSDYYDTEEEAREAYEHLLELLKRVNSRPR